MNADKQVQMEAVKLAANGGRIFMKMCAKSRAYALHVQFPHQRECVCVACNAKLAARQPMAVH